MCLLLVTNVSVIIRFDTAPLIAASVNYEDSLWRQSFANLVDNQITQASQIKNVV